MCAEILHERVEVHLSHYHCFLVPDNLIFSATDAFDQMAALVLQLGYDADVQELRHEVDDVHSYHDS